MDGSRRREEGWRRGLEGMPGENIDIRGLQEVW